MTTQGAAATPNACSAALARARARSTGSGSSGAGSAVARSGSGAQPPQHQHEGGSSAAGRSVERSMDEVLDEEVRAPDAETRDAARAVPRRRKNF